MDVSFVALNFEIHSNSGKLNIVGLSMRYSMNDFERKLKALETEIDFYKGLAGKVFTANLLLIGATITVIKTSGLCFWSVAGAVFSYIFTTSLIIFIKEWRDRVNRIKELCDADT